MLELHPMRERQRSAPLRQRDAGASHVARSLTRDAAFGFCRLGILGLLAMPMVVKAQIQAQPPLPSSAQASSPAAVLAVQAGADLALLDFLQTTRSYAADFIHEQSASGGKVQRFSGRMALERPGKFRWEIRKPYSQLQLIRDQQFFLYDPDLAQLTIRLLDSSQLSSPASLLLLAGPEAANQVRERFDLKTLPSRDDKQWVMVTPKAGGADLQSLEVGLTLKGELVEFQMLDAMGRRGRVILSAASRNRALPPGLFEFKAPPGTEVLRP